MKNNHSSSSLSDEISVRQENSGLTAAAQGVETTEGKTENSRRLIHDLRDPLNAISMNAELARLQVETAANPEKTLLCLDRILEECERCAQTLTRSEESAGSPDGHDSDPPFRETRDIGASARAGRDAEQP